MWRVHIIKRSRDFYSCVSLPHVTNLPILVAIDIMEAQIYFTFVTRKRDQKVTWPGMWGLSMVSYHSTKFDDNSYCGNAAMSFFHFSRDHVITRSYDFEGGIPPS